MTELDCSERLRALSHPIRMEVVRALLAHGPQHVGQLNEQLGLEPSLLSHHLRILREAELLCAERDGKAVLYRLAPGVRRRGGRGVDLQCCTLSFAEDEEAPGRSQSSSRSEGARR